MKINKQFTGEKVLYLLLVMLPLIPYSKVLPEEINSIVFLLLSLVLVMLIYKGLVKKDISSLLILFILLGFLSLIVSKDKVISLMDSFYFLSGILVYIIVTKTKTELTYKFHAVFIGGAVSSALGIIRYLTYSDLRLDGILNYANTSALFFAVCIVLYFFKLKDGLPKGKVQYLYKAGLLCLTTALYLTQSRGGIIIYFLAFVPGMFLVKGKKGKVLLEAIITNSISIGLAYLVMNREFLIAILISPIFIFFVLYEVKDKPINRKILISSTFLFIIGIIGIIIKSFSRLADISINNAQLQERLIFYKDGLKLIQHNLLGIGSGNYAGNQYIYQSADYSIKYIHNGFLQLAIDYGVVFLCAFVFFLIFVIIQAIKNGKIKIVESIIILMILVHSMLDFSLNFVLIDLILFLCLGELAKTEKISSKKMGLFTPFLILMAIINLAIVGVFPGELIYNISTNMADKGNVNKAYNVLFQWKSITFKTQRHHEKLAIWGIELYNNSSDKKYLKDVISEIDKAISFNDLDPRMYETKGKICYFLKDYKLAAYNLEKSKERRIFYRPTYDALIELGKLK